VTAARRVSFMVPDSVWDAAKATASAAGESMPAVLNRIVAAYLDAGAPDEPDELRTRVVAAIDGEAWAAARALAAHRAESLSEAIRRELTAYAQQPARRRRS
jgi:hypothetical protein